MEDEQMVFFLSLVVLPGFFEMKTYFYFSKKIRFLFLGGIECFGCMQYYTHVGPIGK